MTSSFIPQSRRCHPTRSAALWIAVSLLFGVSITWGAPPERRSSLQTVLAEQGYSAVPLVRASTGHLQLRAVLNGQTVRFILDTGAPTAVLDRARCERFGLPLIRKGVGASGIGTAAITADVASIRSLQIGNIDLRNVAAAVTDLSVVNQKSPKAEEVDGILGADVLTRTKAIIDCDALRLYVKASSGEKR